MKIRRLYILLVVWFALLTGPATLVASGVFGYIDAQKSISGGLVLCWILGYLAQFGVFMWIMSKVDNPNVLSTVTWWLLASLLPWALDWTPPRSPLFLVWCPVSIGLACWIAFVARRAKVLQEHGIRAVGVVLEVLKPLMNVVINNIYIKRKVRLRIERADRVPAYEAVYNGLFMLGEIPSPGDRIPVIIDPANPQRVDYDKGRDGDIDAARSAPMQQATQPAEGHGSESIGDELERLASLRERGALTDAEFAAAKKKLLC